MTLRTSSVTELVSQMNEQYLYHMDQENCCNSNYYEFCERRPIVLCPGLAGELNYSSASAPPGPNWF